MIAQHHGGPDILAIGASAGGVEAIQALMHRLPSSLPAAVLIVLHRSPFAHSYLPEIIARSTRMKVLLAKENARLERGICLVGPPDRYLTVTPELRVRLVPDAYYRGQSIDMLFNALARCAGPRTIGVVLSGLLKDGTQGLNAIKEAGGIALVQAPSEATYADMPLNAIRHNGPIDLIGSVEAIAREVCHRLSCLPIEDNRPVPEPNDQGPV